MMNSRERVFKALAGEVPDRVPLMELFIDQKVVETLSPGKTYAEFVAESPQDVIVCELFSSQSQEMDWIDKERRTFRDKWEAIQVFTTELMPFPVNPPRIESEQDLLSYTPPNPNEPHLLDEIKGIIKRCKDKKAIAFVGETGFAPAQYLRAGMERLMLDFALRPDLVKKLVKIGEEYYIELYRRLIKEGIEIIILGDDYAGKKGTFISPKAFEEYLLPGISRVVKEIKKLGAYCIIHTCGNIWEIIDRLVQTGIDGLGPLQPDAGMDLNLVKEKYGNTLCVIGNVSVDHLCRFSPEEIIEETKNLLFKVSDKGGHILSSSNSITSTVKPQNFLVMMETVEKYGKYPINLSLGGGNKCYTNSV